MICSENVCDRLQNALSRFVTGHAFFSQGSSLGQVRGNLEFAPSEGGGDPLENAARHFVIGAFETFVTRLQNAVTLFF